MITITHTSRDQRHVYKRVDSFLPTHMDTGWVLSETKFSRRVLARSNTCRKSLRLPYDWHTWKYYMPTVDLLQGLRWRQTEIKGHSCGLYITSHNHKHSRTNDPVLFSITTEFISATEVALCQNSRTYSFWLAQLSIYAKHWYKRN